MNRFTTATALFCACVVLGISFTHPATAQVQGAPLTIQATNASGTGSLIFDWNQAVWNGTTQTWTWSQPASLQIKSDANATLATLLNASVTVRLDQTYTNNVNVGLIAGTSDTTFSISSCLSSVALVPSSLATAKATASFTVTDQNGNGALLIGTDGGAGGAFKAHVNGCPPVGTQFSNLVGIVACSAGGTATGSQADPPIGYRAVGQDLNSMTDRLEFTLSAGDRAYATTGFTSPEPAPCPGDLNHDYVADLSDLVVVLNAFGACSGSPEFTALADSDNDGCITLNDLAYWLTYYGTNCL